MRNPVVPSLFGVFLCSSLAYAQTSGAVWRHFGWNGNHFYTNNCSESTNVQKQDGNDKYYLDKDGPHFFLFTTPVPGTTPLYRFRGPAAERNLSLDPNEGVPPMVNEGVIGYAYAPSSPGPDRTPLYRSENKHQLGDRLFTISPAEHGAALKGSYAENKAVPIAALVPTNGTLTCKPEEIAMTPAAKLKETGKEHCFFAPCDPANPANPSQCKYCQ